MTDKRQLLEDLEDGLTCFWKDTKNFMNLFSLAKKTVPMMEKARGIEINVSHEELTKVCENVQARVLRDA